MFDVHVLAAEQKVCVIFVTYVLMSASHRKHVREWVLDAMEVVKADAQEGLVGDSPGSMEFRKQLKTDASQLTKMNKDVGQDNGANVVKAQHRIRSLFKRAQDAPVDITEYLASFDSAAAREDKMRACDWEDLAFARILRGYKGAEEGNTAEKWTAAVKHLFMEEDTTSNSKIMKTLKRAISKADDSSELILVQEKACRGHMFAQEYENGVLQEGIHACLRSRVGFKGDLLTNRSRFLERWKLNMFGATIFIDPFWTVDNLHQNRRSKEFGVFFNLLLDELPKEDELTVNLGRYEPSHEAALGILRAIDVEIASEVEMLLDEEIGDYGRLCQELKADGY
ncbi:hypothetical protein C8R47DRAFT_1258842 [Mycena vitilis]|nr:hypothetical protein C8R47DRAFT_1258842 [Mycena vitilis]